MRDVSNFLFLADGNLRKLGDAAAKSLNEATWMNESVKHATRSVYDETIMQVLIFARS